ncbi:MAG: hypothetical protein EBS96_11330 [Spartobacteria bacterium]|nr:hypothetical protein [Spartobacteria bacterium]
MKGKKVNLTDRKLAAIVGIVDSPEAFSAGNGGPIFLGVKSQNPISRGSLPPATRWRAAKTHSTRHDGGNFY